MRGSMLCNNDGMFIETSTAQSATFTERHHKHQFFHNKQSIHQYLQVLYFNFMQKHEIVLH